MLILAVETSAGPSSCAIIDYDARGKDAGINADKKKIISSNFINVGLTHSETLMPMIDGVLSNSKLSIADIDIFAVASGPGSFTGVRIGVSAVKGIAFTLDLNENCIGLSTLESMAYMWSGGTGKSGFKGIICPAMDARRGQVYTALFRCENGVITRICDDIATGIDELFSMLAEFPKDEIILMGDGAELCFSHYNNVASAEMKAIKISLAIESLRFQNAVGVAMLACERIDEAISANYLMPSYLRLPQAERERLDKQKNEA